MRVPERLVAVVRHAPALGGAPGRVNVEAALKQTGVERVVQLGSYAGSTPAVAVVGRTYWHAQQGAHALDIEWQPPPSVPLDSARIAASLERAARDGARADGGFAFHRHGDVRSAEKSAARRIEAVYRAPYLAHATMEPINCTARVKDGKVDVWAPTQVPDFARLIAARVADVPESAVTVHVTYLGGGFGRRLEVDFIGQAVRIALETGGRAVQLVWPREEDITHDFYRPASVALMQASLDAGGQPARHLDHERGRRGDAALLRAHVCAARDADRPARQDHSRGIVRPAVRHRAPAHRARRDEERRAGRFMAIGRPFAERVLRRRLHRRARASRRSRTRSPFAWRCWSACRAMQRC